MWGIAKLLCLNPVLKTPREKCVCVYERVLWLLARSIVCLLFLSVRFTLSHTLLLYVSSKTMYYSLQLIFSLNQISQNTDAAKKKKNTTKKAFKIMHLLISRQTLDSSLTSPIQTALKNNLAKKSKPQHNHETRSAMFVWGQRNASSARSSLLHDQMRNALPLCLYSSNYAGKVSYYGILLPGPNTSAGFDMGYDRVIMRWHNRKGIGEGLHLRRLWNGKYSPLNQNIRACNLLPHNNIYCFSLLIANWMTMKDMIKKTMTGGVCMRRSWRRHWSDPPVDMHMHECCQSFRWPYNDPQKQSLTNSFIYKNAQTHMFTHSH